MSFLAQSVVHLFDSLTGQQLRLVQSFKAPVPYTNAAHNKMSHFISANRRELNAKYILFD